MRRDAIGHRFVEFIPGSLEDGVLYLSLEYATAVHKCCCGCGERVVTPLTPTDWSVIYDGETVSLDPSVGNWGFECGSHYWIDRGRVRWAGRWTEEEVEAGRRRDHLRKARYYGDEAETPPVLQRPEGRIRRFLRNLLRR